MRKYFFFIALFAGSICFKTTAQPNQIDSLKRLLQNVKSDTAKVMILYKLSTRLLQGNPDSAMLYANEGLTLSRQIRFLFGAAATLKNIAYAFGKAGNYPKSLELNLEVLQQFEDLGDQSKIASTLTQIAYVYYRMKDYPMARKYLFKAKSIAEKTANQLEMANCNADLGDNYEKSGMLDSALYFDNLAYNQLLHNGDAHNVAVELGNLGNLYSKMRQDAIALDYYRSSKGILYQYYDYDSYCELALGMAETFRREGRNDSALYYASQAFEIAKKSELDNWIMESSIFLTDYYRSKKNVDSAFRYQTFILASKDSLFNQEKTRELQNISLNEMFHEQQEEAARQEALKERSETIEYEIMAIGLVCFVVIFFLLTQSIIINEQWIQFLGILGLLLVFEFLNLYLHPYIARFTNHSPVLMLLVGVCIAGLLIMPHKKIEHWISHGMINKHKRLRLAAARRTVQKLEGNVDE